MKIVLNIVAGMGLVAIGWLVKLVWGTDVQRMVLYVVLAGFVLLALAVVFVRLKVGRDLKRLSTAELAMLAKNLEPDDAECLADSSSRGREFLWEILKLPVALLVCFGPVIVCHLFRYRQLSPHDPITWMDMVVIVFSCGGAAVIQRFLKRRKK